MFDDKKAFAGLVAQRQAAVARLAQRLLGYRGDVEDAVQEVFLAAWKHRRRFRGRFGDRSLDAWLTRITINTCRNIQRKQRLRRWLLLPDRDLPAPVPHDPAEKSEMLDQLRRALTRLSCRDRELLVLYHLEQMPPAEIADMLKITRNALDVRLHRARRRLAELM